MVVIFVGGEVREERFGRGKEFASAAPRQVRGQEVEWESSIFDAMSIICNKSR